MKYGRNLHVTQSSLEGICNTVHEAAVERESEIPIETWKSPHLPKWASGTFAFTHVVTWLHLLLLQQTGITWSILILFSGGWWHDKCEEKNLNGKYTKPIGIVLPGVFP